MSTGTLNDVPDGPTTDRMPIVTEEERPLLETIGQIVRYPQGSILFGQGETTDFALLIRKGYVKVKQVSMVRGSEESMVAVRGPGETVGELAAMDGGPRSASVYAAVDVEALYLSRKGWLGFLHQNPRSMEALLREVCGRLREASNKQREQGDLAADQLLARRLAELGDKTGQRTHDGLFVVGFTQDELAGYAGISRRAVNAAMKRLSENKIAESAGHGKFLIKNIQALHDIAAGELIVRTD